MLHRLVHDIFHRREPKEADLDFLNKSAHRAHPPYPQLCRIKKGEWQLEMSTPVAVPQILAIIARDAIDLLGGADRAFLRECAGATCDGIYVDRSRGFRRQWCSSKTCGNQARVDRFRAKAASPQKGAAQS